MEISVLADAGVLDPCWSAYVASEVTRVLLYEKAQRRGAHLLSRAEYERFRTSMNKMIAALDQRYTILRVADPAEDELDWARANDEDDLHLQLLARAAGADCVISDNTDDFPNPATAASGLRRGELCGVVWVQPEDIMSIFHDAM